MSMALLQVQVLPGFGPGMPMQIRTPEGRIFVVTIPQGVVSGMSFQVQVPAPQQTVIVQQQQQPVFTHQVVHHGGKVKVKGFKGGFKAKGFKGFKVKGFKGGFKVKGFKGFKSPFK